MNRFPVGIRLWMRRNPRRYCWYFYCYPDPYYSPDNALDPSIHPEEIKAVGRSGREASCSYVNNKPLLVTRQLASYRYFELIC